MATRSIPLIFEEVAAANSFEARKKVLLENESNPLKDLLRYAFHPDIKFARVDADSIDKLIQKDDVIPSKLSEKESSARGMMTTPLSPFATRSRPWSKN